MKKILIAVISAMMLFPCAASSQVKVKPSMQVETLASLKQGNINLMSTGGSYALGISSSNEYEKAYIILLGDSQVQAIESLDTFIQVAETITDSTPMEFENFNETIKIFKGAFTGEIWFKTSRKDGWGKITKAELKQLKKALEK